MTDFESQLHTAAADAVARGVIKPSFAELLAQALGQAAFARFDSDAHKLAVIGLLIHSHQGDVIGEFQVSCDDRLGLDTISQAARCSRNIAIAIRDDLMACKALEWVGPGGECRLIWPRAAQ